MNKNIIIDFDSIVLDSKKEDDTAFKFIINKYTKIGYYDIIHNLKQHILQYLVDLNDNKIPNVNKSDFLKFAYTESFKNVLKINEADAKNAYEEYIELREKIFINNDFLKSIYELAMHFKICFFTKKSYDEVLEILKSNDINIPIEQVYSENFLDNNELKDSIIITENFWLIKKAEKLNIPSAYYNLENYKMSKLKYFIDEDHLAITSLSDLLTLDNTRS